MLRGRGGGVLAAWGNLGLRELIRTFTWLLQKREWDLLRIPQGMPSAMLVPVVLISGGIVIIAMEYLFPGDIMGYGFPKFLETIHLGDARLKWNWIFTKARGPPGYLGACSRVGRAAAIAPIRGQSG